MRLTVFVYSTTIAATAGVATSPNPNQGYVKTSPPADAPLLITNTGGLADYVTFTAVPSARGATALPGESVVHLSNIPNDPSMIMVVGNLPSDDAYLPPLQVKLNNGALVNAYPQPQLSQFGSRDQQNVVLFSGSSPKRFVSPNGGDNPNASWSLRHMDSGDYLLNGMFLACPDAATEGRYAIHASKGASTQEQESCVAVQFHADFWKAA